MLHEGFSRRAAVLLAAAGKDARPVGKMGIGCWAYNLCPSKGKSQEFMLDYMREMFFDFYPNADRLLFERTTPSATARTAASDSSRRSSTSFGQFRRKSGRRSPRR
jgi:hypothetical protein